MTYYYVCDACGSFVTIGEAPIAEGSGWACYDCGCRALWEFTNQRKAMEHGENIRRSRRGSLTIRRAK